MSHDGSDEDEQVGCAVFAFPAEADLTNSQALHDGALSLLERGVPGLVLDLTGCTFCDSSGIAVIFRVQVRAKALDIPMRVVLPRAGIVRRVCDVTGVTRVMRLADDVEAARGELDARPAGPPPR